MGFRVPGPGGVGRKHVGRLAEEDEIHDHEPVGAYGGWGLGFRVDGSGFRV